METVVLWGCSLKLSIRAHSLRIPRNTHSLIWSEDSVEVKGLSTGWQHCFSDLSAFTPLPDSRFVLLRTVRICATLEHGWLFKGPCPERKLSLTLPVSISLSADLQLGWEFTPLSPCPAGIFIHLAQVLCVLWVYMCDCLVVPWKHGFLIFHL